MLHNFNLYHWLFDTPTDAGSAAGLSGAEPFHYYVAWIVFCAVGLLIWFYYTVEGRKRFVKSMPVTKYMFDRFLGWFAVICFIGFPLIFCRAYLYDYFFAWRFWRVLWVLSLVAWGIVWLVYLARKYPKERANFIAYQNQQRYVPKSKQSNKRKTKALSR